MGDQQDGNFRVRNKTRSLILGLTAGILILLLVMLLFYVSDNESYRTIFTCGLVLLTIMLGLLFLIILRFFNGIQEIDNNATMLSQGKLNISDIMVDKTKGFETLTLAFNEMKRNLLSFIESTKSNVITLSDAVDKVSKSLEMGYKGNEQIASNMATVAEKAQEQLQIVKDTLERIEDVSERTNRITNTLENIEGFVENTVKITEVGSGHLDRYTEQMNVISSDLSDTANYIETLNTHLKEIDQVNGLIINITEQLKLLSLNSAVEAARAGDAGKGFVVVAQEMNKLSTLTRDSISQIDKLLSNIFTSNSKVSDSIDSCVNSFNTSKEIFDTVKDSFYTINKNANILNDDMKKVYEESRLINDTTKGINDMALIIHDASNEISSITQDVAAVTEEELAENEEINNQAVSLQNMISGIEKLLKRYKTSVVPVNKVSEKKLRIAFVSPLDHPFWEGVRQGALYAKNELKAKNVEVEYIGFERVTDNLAKAFEQKVDELYDGVIAPGFMGESVERTQRAFDKNVPIMAFNCDFPEGAKRISYFGPDIHASGIRAGELIAKAMDDEGQVIILYGGMGTSVNKARYDAVVEVIHKKRKIKIVDELEIDQNTSEYYTATMDFLEKYPDLKGIVVVTSGIEYVAKAIVDSGRVGKTKMVCFDYNDKIIEYIKKDVIYAAMGQDPFGQGHDPIITMYNYLVANEVPAPITYTRTEVIDIRSVKEEI